MNIDRPEMSCYDIDSELRKCFKLMNARSIKEARVIAQEGGIIEEMAKDIEKFNKDEWITDYFSVESMWERKLNDTAELKLQEGINLEKIETAKNLLKLGKLTINDIAKTTGLEIEKIQALQNS